MAPAKLPQLPTPEIGYVPFIGGLDTETPTWEVKAGFLREAKNYECGVNGGYRDIAGFQRVDGNPVIDNAFIRVIPLSQHVVGDDHFVIGGTVTQDTSGATATLVGYEAPDDGYPYIVINDITGTFDDQHEISIDAVEVGFPQPEATNRLFQTTDFSTSWPSTGPWTRTNLNIISSTETAPTGAATATDLQSSGAGARLRVRGNSGGMHLMAGDVATFSVYLKQSGAYDHVAIVALDNGEVQVGVIDLSDGSISQAWAEQIVSDVAGSVEFGALNVDAAANSFYRVWFTISCQEHDHGTDVYIIPLSSGSYTWPDNAPADSQKVIIWGPQMEFASQPSTYSAVTLPGDPIVTNGTHSPEAYATYIQAARDDVRDQVLEVPGTGSVLGVFSLSSTLYALRAQVRRNLFDYSEFFAASYWTKTAVTVTYNDAIGPDGAQVAAGVVAQNSAGAHGIQRAITLTANAYYVVSVYAKADGYNYLRLSIAGAVSGTPKGRIFNLTNGTSSAADLGAPIAYSATAVGSGWYRCVIEVQADGVGGAATVTFGPHDGGATADFTGDATSGVSVWGAQIEVGTAETDYQAIFDAPGNSNFGRWFYSTTAGWEPVRPAYVVAFTSGGTTAIAEGDTVTGATSAATAVVLRVSLESGSWGAGTAAGRLFLAPPSGVFQAENLDVGASLNLATIAAAPTAVTWLTGGRVEAVRSSFEGAFVAERIYGVDGVNKAWEFDGDYFYTIATGMTTDTPTHIAVYKNRLALSFGRSVQLGTVGDPFAWTPITGAAEIATAAAVTGFSVESGSEGSSALAIFTQKKAYILYGDADDNFNLVPQRDQVGAYEWSIQQFAYTMFLDDLGITSLRATDVYGNFQQASLSAKIQSWLTPKRGSVVSSMVVRDKNQYRLFFSDGTALYITMSGGKVLGMMPVDLGQQALCTWVDDEADGEQKLYFGSDDGFVYRLDHGTSFDGSVIDAYLYLHFTSLKSPGWLKKYLTAVLEARGDGYAEFEFSFELAYASTDVQQPGYETFDTGFSSGRWDSGNWDSGYWDGRALAPTSLKLSGEGENISFLLRKSSNAHDPVLFSGLRARYLNRRQMRR